MSLLPIIGHYYGNQHPRIISSMRNLSEYLNRIGQKQPLAFIKYIASTAAPSCIILLPLMSSWNQNLMRTIIYSLIAGSLFFNSVWADHEADHRYNIRGYVLNANQKGIDNLTVQAFAEGELLGTSKTGPDGHYSMHLHLHNSDYHRILKLRAGSHEADLRVTFDVKDDTSARIHEANFVDGKFIEGNLGRFRIPPWSYAVGGLLLFMMILVYLEKRRKKKIRLAKYGTTEMHPTAKHRAKKSRRKKH